jgi:hypothetical protein
LGRGLIAFVRLVAVDQLLGEAHAFASTRYNRLQRSACRFADSWLTLAKGSNVHHGIAGGNQRLYGINGRAFSIGATGAKGNEEQGEPDPETAAKQKTHRDTSNIRRLSRWIDNKANRVAALTR